jgi:hypothetical protein|tara:strand:+ start:306 stop:1070 length:765 start_codon:yes stop_codon:yes gene_type:complete
MEEKHQFPTEEVTLPSKGLLYPEGSPLKKGVIEMKYMTAKEEDILTNINLIKSGTVLDKLLQSLIVTPIDYKNLLVGDKNAILIAARILGYGPEYDIMLNHPETGIESKATIDLTELEDKEIDVSTSIEGRNEFSFTLPTSKKEITFKLLTHEDETKIEQEIKGLEKLNRRGFEGTTKLKHVILSIEGNYDKKTVREFIDNAFLARDSRALRNHIKDISPDVTLQANAVFEDGAVEPNVMFPLGSDFFWPDAGI